jgi:hypothetical protein
VHKLQKIANTRKFDCDSLSMVADELIDRINASARESAANEEDAKYVRLENTKTQMSLDLNQLNREVQTLIAKERELNEQVLTLDRIYEDKVKLAKEM